MIKTITVTSCGKFLGLNLCSRLIYENHKVICADNIYMSVINNEDFLENLNLS